MTSQPPPPALPAELADRLHLRVARAQHEWRSASVVARIVRRGQPQWDGSAGSADLGTNGLADPPLLQPSSDVQYRIGSITKTFTAALVLQARDDGYLDLDDRLDAHLDVPAHGEVTLRRMLCHLSGLQREPVGRIWENLSAPDLPALLAGLSDAEAVLSPHQRWHYSNLAYALLGQVVAERREMDWPTLIEQRLLSPLGMTRTTCAPTAPVARGYSTDPYADRLRPEPLFPGKAFAPAAELWSTTADLARWAAFWADPDDSVLSATTVAEMTHLHTMADQDTWMLGWGLGLMLHRCGERMLVGHDGSMPGFLASMVVERRSGVGVVVLTNNGRTAEPNELALELACLVLDAVPDPVLPWRPGAAVPADAEGLLGTWWVEGDEFTACWRAGDDDEVDGADRGHLELRAVSAAAGVPPSVLRRAGDDRWRGVSGREQGELLEVLRDESGEPCRLYWASYPMTRRPLPFDG